MTDSLKVAIAQLNTTAGDISGNVGRFLVAWRDAGRQGADLVVASEFLVTGGPLGDMVRKPSLLKMVRDTVNALARETVGGPSVLLGVPWEEEGKVVHAALFLDEGRIAAKIFQTEAGSFFEAGEKPRMPIIWRDHRLGVVIGKDASETDKAYEMGEKGAEILFVLSATPYEQGGQEARMNKAQALVAAAKCPLVYLNAVGGSDERVFDGASFVMGRDGSLCVQTKAFCDDILCFDCALAPSLITPKPAPFVPPAPEGVEADYEALLLGVRDYVRKNGFTNIVVELTGQVDDALVATLAVDALGEKAVQAVLMPSEKTSGENIADAKEMAKVLGCHLFTLPITTLVQSYEYLLAEAFAGCEPDMTEDRLRSRCRGSLLMAMMNKSGGILFSSVNKSSLATGACALYGNMSGGYAPLKDVYKTRLYDLMSWRNVNKPPSALGPSGTFVVERILTKPPAPSQLVRNESREDYPLPPVLDPILEGLLEHHLTVAGLAARFDAAVVKKVAAMVTRAEYKRRQAPMGPKITACHLTLDRHYPATNRFVEK